MVGFNLSLLDSNINQFKNLHSIMVGFNRALLCFQNLDIEIYIPLWSDSIRNENQLRCCS